jgi:hypothetical protein
MKNSVLMRSINTLYFRQNNSLILKLTSGERKMYLRRNFQIRDCKVAFFIFRRQFIGMINVQDYFNHLVEKPEIVLEDAHHPSLLPQFSFCITSSENIAQFQGRLSYNFRTAVLTNLYDAVSS